ncbi:hypothetical protein J2S43_001821 [Catenuloplanes nepalensis]|uniref:Uncharacterized protein n=1 Tax=Catenuloplanes nepalensis TaxID=587533 RepID=A0ABT9MPJ9_9ACTN|nr:hypothetical protein [Catenuloplanes nepalensis]MDP9793309.1 hypothetical protein [Catenuloplanes nepalensis]
MQVRSVVVAFVAVGALVAGGAVPATAGVPLDPPHPTPGGPTPPAEPPVSGPVNLDSLTASVRPDGGGRRGVAVTFDRASRTASGEKPAAATQFVFLFDRALSLHPEHFPVCDRGSLPAGCDPGSIVGTGSAVLYPGLSADVVVHNTRFTDGARGVLITIPATGTVLENRFERVRGPYRGRFRWGSDELLPSALPPAERGATTRFTVTFGATANGHSFVTTDSRRPLTLGLWSRFVTGQTLLVTDRT